MREKKKLFVNKVKLNETLVSTSGFIVYINENAVCNFQSENLLYNNKINNKLIKKQNKKKTKIVYNDNVKSNFYTTNMSTLYV